MISRRHFLLGSAAGAILPSFFEQALSFLENHGEPLLLKPKNSRIVLTVVSESELELIIGNPDEEPPDISIEEFIRDHWHEQDVESCLIDAFGFDPDDLPDVQGSISDIDSWMWFDTWCRTESPNAKAFRYLNELNLGHELTGPDAIGGIQFIDGPCPGNDYLGVRADNLISVSLLQKRLVDLGEAVTVRLV